MSEPEALAKLVWHDPVTGQLREFVLTEGATATIGRSSNNDIPIPEEHVSRQHAVVTYRDGVFMVNDLGSSNGTFVNDQRIEEPFPLFAGDVIRLFQPEIRFLAADVADYEEAKSSGHLLVAPSPSDTQCSLIVTNGPQEGQTIALLLDTITIGRATTTATWEILLQDQSVSRPHARLERIGLDWDVIDLGSSNGTFVNQLKVEANQRCRLNNGDTLTLGGAKLLFRVGWNRPSSEDYSPTIPPRR